MVAYGYLTGAWNPRNRSTFITAGPVTRPRHRGGRIGSPLAGPNGDGSRTAGAKLGPVHTNRMRIMIMTCMLPERQKLLALAPSRMG